MDFGVLAEELSLSQRSNLAVMKGDGVTGGVSRSRVSRGDLSFPVASRDIQTQSVTPDFNSSGQERSRWVRMGLA